MFKHFLKTWKSHFTLQLSALTVLAACYSVVVGVILVNFNLSNILTLWGENLQMNVYLKEDVSPQAVASLEKWLSANTLIESYKLITGESALKDFHSQISNYAPDLLQDSELSSIIPTSFQLSISRAVEAADQLSTMQSISAGASSLPAVSEVSFGQDWVKTYSNVINGFQTVGAGFVLIIILASVFVMANSIQSSISQRRNEIEVMELIGATAKQIRLPYIIEGAIQSFIACLLAICFTAVITDVLRSLLSGKFYFSQLSTHLTYLNAGSLFVIVLSSLLIGALSSFLVVRSINTGWAASQTNREFS